MLAFAKFLSACGQHLWRGLTFRHDLTGLPKEPGLVIFLCALGIVAAMIRFGGVALEVGFLAALYLMFYAFSPKDLRPLAWLAIASVAMDVVIVALSLPKTYAIVIEIWVAIAATFLATMAGGRAKKK